MPYKDKEKQKQATRERVQRWRAKAVTPNNVTPPLPPERIKAIDRIVEYRKELGLEDDLAERLQCATDYRQWELSRYKDPR